MLARCDKYWFDAWLTLYHFCLCLQFFTKNNVPDVLSQYDMFNDITGMNLAGGGREFLQQVSSYTEKELNSFC